MTSNEIRSSFLNYFERQGHRIVPSSPLVPHDDPTLLFTNAGMNQFKNVFLGKERRDYARAASSQKCMRVSGKHNDLENVGPSLRHHTFFEMLGNFSFGDYFKKDAIAFAWELLTEGWKLPADHLYATVFSGEAGIPRDEEAYRWWLRFVPEERITELGLSDNFWSMGDTGPCGRCSEIHYFRGTEVPCPEPVCRGLACTCDRFIEIWNNVFMEFDRQPGGTLNPLPALSVDTGMGLERMVAVLQDKVSNYNTDLFRPIINKIAELTGVSYGPYATGHPAPGDVSIRVIADHIRAMTFLIADGVAPSNEWRGYVLRKIMRRAMRHGKHLRMTRPFLFELVDVLVTEMSDAYPEIRTSRSSIRQVILNEEMRFDAVLNEGLPRLEVAVSQALLDGRPVLAGEHAFRLYDTYGLPLDFIEDVAGQQGVGVDREGFEREMEGQRQRARAGSTFEARKAKDFSFGSDESRETLRKAGDPFEGYTATELKGVPILALFDEERRETPELREGQTGYVALEKTPFYLEAGGQVSDIGRIYSESGGSEATVEAVMRPAADWPRLHRVRLVSGALHERDLVTVEVDAATRDAIRRNHTATHLLHAALRQVLGPHVKQAGSLVAPDRLRFDFLHHAACTREELEEIERIVNEQIYRNTPVQTEIRSTEEAIAAGAMALFGEKYSDRVRVVSIPDFSTELCGGTHVRATGDIGLFTIVQEGGIAAGVRRIEAVTGAASLERYRRNRSTLESILGALNAPPEQAAEAIERLQADVKRLSREVTQLKMKAAMAAPATAGADDVQEINGVKFVARNVEGLERPALRGLADSLTDHLRSGIVVLAAPAGDKVSIIVSVTPDLTGRLHAGRIVKQIAPIIGGGGGGRPDFAEAGGRDPSKIDELLAASKRVVTEMLGAR